MVFLVAANIVYVTTFILLNQIVTTIDNYIFGFLILKIPLPRRFWLIIIEYRIYVVLVVFTSELNDMWAFMQNIFPARETSRVHFVGDIDQAKNHLDVDV
jgi:hypothetical protein